MKKVIQSLLTIINDFDNDSTCKEVILDVKIIGEGVHITKLCTKGEAYKGTPFYFGNMKTYVVTEEWVGGKIIYANILAEAKDS